MVAAILDFDVQTQFLMVTFCVFFKVFNLQSGWTERIPTPPFAPQQTHTQFHRKTID